MYRIGDVVSVNSDRGEVSKMQKGHGDWVEDMIEVCLCMYHMQVYVQVLYTMACSSCPIMPFSFSVSTQSLGQPGKVVKVLPSGDVQVAVKGRRWVFSPSCLQPAPGEQPQLEASE